MDHHAACGTCALVADESEPKADFWEDHREHELCEHSAIPELKGKSASFMFWLSKAKEKQQHLHPADSAGQELREDQERPYDLEDEGSSRNHVERCTYVSADAGGSADQHPGCNH